MDCDGYVRGVDQEIGKGLFRTFQSASRLGSKTNLKPTKPVGKEVGIRRKDGTMVIKEEQGGEEKGRIQT